VAELAEIGDSVAFQVDHHASDFRIAWSVLTNGTLSFLDAEASAAYAELRLQPVAWPRLGQHGDRPVRPGDDLRPRTSPTLTGPVLIDGRTAVQRSAVVISRGAGRLGVAGEARIAGANGTGARLRTRNPAVAGSR
jgi:hypothetical protein